MGITYHPYINGKIERLNLVKEDILQTYVLNYPNSWEDHQACMEFAYNNSYYLSIMTTPLEVLHRKPYRSPSCCLDFGHGVFIGSNMVRDTTEAMELITKRIKDTQSPQKSYADRKGSIFSFVLVIWFI